MTCGCYVMLARNRGGALLGLIYNCRPHTPRRCPRREKRGLIARRAATRREYETRGRA